MTEIGVEQVSEMVERGESIVLLDVREGWEVEMGTISGSVHIPLGELAARAGELDATKPVVVFCHSGRRSLAGARILTERGFEAASMAGGIDAWSVLVDPTIPQY